MSESSKSAGMRRPSSLRSSRLVARLARLTVSVALLFVGGCPLFVMDQNAYETGKVLQTGKVRLSASTFAYAPMRASVDRRGTLPQFLAASVSRCWPKSGSRCHVRPGRRAGVPLTVR
ncbi:MAG: hypothetical protein NTX53_14660 [candidate division WOR-3 bacterium]|nr:hypothetical protein [candidate division WOR-3 bacterium]